MQHSTAARYAAWQARYVHPATMARERRLGLGAGPVFTAAPNRSTVLSAPEAGPLTALRASWRTLVVAPPRPISSGYLRHPDSMRWTGSGRGAGAHRPTVAAAWRA